MAEDHCLADGDAAVDVAEGSVLLLPAPAHEEVLLDVAQGELVLIHLVRRPIPSKPSKKGEKTGKQDASPQESSPLNAYALRGEALSVNHDVGFIQHEQLDLLHVYESVFEAPVQHRPRRPDDDLLLQPASESTSLERAPRFLSYLLLRWYLGVYHPPPADKITQRRGQKTELCPQAAS
uniref:Uncharacterized protein n=1 Tax=Strix occidentalis caurina TaxID=311401 RepID=A0A8D0FS82_STROC